MVDEPERRRIVLPSEAGRPPANSKLPPKIRLNALERGLAGLASAHQAICEEVLTQQRADDHLLHLLHLVQVQVGTQRRLLLDLGVTEEQIQAAQAEEIALMQEMQAEAKGEGEEEGQGA